MPQTTFRFASSASRFVSLEDNISIPTERDIGAFLASKHDVPCFVRKEFDRSVDTFVESETTKFFDRSASDALQRIKRDPTRRKTIATQWASAFESEVKQYAKPSTPSDDELLCALYEELLESDPSNVTSLLALESRFSKEIRSILTHRDHAVSLLQTEHAQLIAEAGGKRMTDAEAASRAARVFERINLTEVEHASKVSALVDEQRREYRQFLLDLQEKRTLLASSGTSSLNPPRASLTSRPDDLVQSGTDLAPLEESFTIHLGAQMKTMHNVRLLAVSPYEALCFRNFTQIEASHRLHMWLSLYSSNLSALVLLVDSKVTYHLDEKTEFVRACEQSPELHFGANLEAQLTNIEHDSRRAQKWRELRALSSNDSTRLVNSASTPSIASAETKIGESGEESTRLRVGDVYITRHSTLAQAHVVFHMVGDEECLRSATKELNSRHACINGLRNIVRICMRFGISTISLPLLLTYELPDNANAAWCLRRAELVLKCVKGFMIEECSTLKGSSGGADGRTVQFILPASIDELVFHQIAEMVPTIFRVANALVAGRTTAMSPSSRSASETQ